MEHPFKMKISSESHRTGMATLNAIQKNWTIQEDLFPHTLSIEKDPHGKEANSPGSKLDAGKNRLGLVFGGFPLALQEVGKVGTFGANKYTDNGWVTVPNGIERYTDALYRHLLKAASGEVLDKDSDLDHLAHAAWNALAVLELRLKDSK